MNDTRKATALEVIEEYRGELEDFHDAWWNDSYEKYRVFWCLDTLYKLIEKSTRPPLVVLEDFAGDMYEYNRMNDIWNNCALAANNIIRRLV